MAQTRVASLISESSLEYLLAEILSYIETSKITDNDINITLEQFGYNIGYKYIEKIVPNTKSIGVQPLDLVKFICKEFWEELFFKKVS